MGRGAWTGKRMNVRKGNSKSGVWRPRPDDDKVLKPYYFEKKDITKRWRLGIDYYEKKADCQAQCDRLNK